MTSQSYDGLPGYSRVPVVRRGSTSPALLSSSLEPHSTHLLSPVPMVLSLPLREQAWAVRGGILLTKAALGFPSDMGSSGTILGKFGQLSPAPRASLISLSSVAIQSHNAASWGQRTCLEALSFGLIRFHSPATITIPCPHNHPHSTSC